MDANPYPNPYPPTLLLEVNRLVRLTLALALTLTLTLTRWELEGEAQPYIGENKQE